MRALSSARPTPCGGARSWRAVVTAAPHVGSRAAGLVAPNSRPAVTALAGGGRAGGAARSDPRNGSSPSEVQLSLNAQLMGASPKATVELVEIWIDVFSAANVAAALGALAAHAHGPGLQGKRMAGALSGALPLLYAHVTEQTEAYGPRELAGVAFALAKLQCSSGPVWESLVRQAAATAEAFRAAEAARTLRALAVSRVRVPLLAELAYLLAGRVTAGAATLSPHQLADAAWALGKLSCAPEAEERDELLSAALDDLAPSVETVAARGQGGEGSAPAFSAFDLASIAWVYATVARDAPGVFAAVGAAAIPRLAEFRPKGMAMLLWGFASSGTPAEKLFAAAGDAVAADLGAYSPQSLSMVVWSFAKAGIKHEHLLARVVAHVEAAPGTLATSSPQALANLLWGLAQQRVAASPAFLSAAAAEFSERMRAFNAAELTMTAWAFATAGLREPSLYHTLWQEVMHRKAAHFSPDQMAQLVWVFATAERRAPHVFDMVARHVPQHLPRLSSRSLSRCAWAFATARYPAPQLMGALSNTLCARCPGGASSTELAITMWAVGTSGASLDRIAACVDRRLAAEPSSFKMRELWAIHRACTAQGRDPPAGLLVEMAARGVTDAQGAEGARTVDITWHAEPDEQYDF
eukprot:jgi/Tetstr1/433901/TSEL_023081.t1